MHGGLAVIDLATDDLITLAEACVWLGERTGRKAPHKHTIRRWIDGGLTGGRRLESARVGSRVYTSIPALVRFLNGEDPAAAKADPSRRRRRREIEATDRELDRILGPRKGA